GVLTGDDQIKQGEEKFPTVQFNLKGSEFGSMDLKASVLETEGTFMWPLVEIVRARGTFDDGSSATAQGRINLEKQAIAGGRLELNGGLVQRWLPAGYSYGGLG